MPSVNERLADAATRRAIDLEYYKTGIVHRMVALLNRADGDIMEQIRQALERMPASAFNLERLEQLLAGVREQNRQAYERLRLALEPELRRLAEYEIAAQAQMLRGTLPTQVSVSVGIANVSAEQVYAAALARPMQVSKDGAVPLNEYLRGLESGRAARIRDAIRLGYVENETIDQIVRRIRGTRANGYADGLLEQPRQHIEGMVRTAVAHTSNFARQRFYEANDDLVKGWQFLATLDNRTSITCASLSGKIFPVGQGPMPPRHINCRSTSVPVVKSWRELGIDLPEVDPGTRSSMDGQVAADLSFSDWLRSKPASVQDEILGRTRGRLFRSNEIDVDRFTTNKGRVYTIEELRRRDAAAFERAGL